jgi:hypothetical protein
MQILALSHAPSLFKLISLKVFFLGFLWISFHGSEAQAIPMFARQTNQMCGKCHAPPPELTQFGRRFMLSGFQLKSTEHESSPRLSLLSYYNYTNIAEDLEQPPTENTKENNNSVFQQVSVYTGGDLKGDWGGLFAIDYNGVLGDVRIGDLDVRRVKSTFFNDKNVLYAFAVNNNPTWQDPWASSALHAWPYLRSEVEPYPRNRAVTDGVLSKRVIGAGGYSFIDNSLYIELTGYRPLGNSMQNMLNVRYTQLPELENTAVYLRVAKEFDFGWDTFTIGGLYFSGKMSGPGNLPNYEFDDFSVDAFYSRDRGDHHFVISANFLTESLDTSEYQKGGLASQDDNRLNRYRFSTSYIYKKHYGIGIGFFELSGSDDPLYFQTENGQPDSRYTRLDIYWNPIAAKKRIARVPFLRSRIGMHFTHFSSFDGRSRNYNGRGRDADDNDTFTFYWALSF